MSMKMGNCSRDTMADRAITKPKSFPKCSEGKLGRETRGFQRASGTLPPSPGLASLAAPLSVPCSRLPLSQACPRPPTPTQHGAALSTSARTIKPQNTEKALCWALGRGQGPGHRLCPGGAGVEGGECHEEKTHTETGHYMPGDGYTVRGNRTCVSAKGTKKGDLFPGRVGTDVGPGGRTGVLTR